MTHTLDRTAVVVATPRPPGDGPPGDGPDAHGAHREAPPRTAELRPRVRPPMPYLPALDGLRAVAVIGVLLFHGDVAAFQGGFLGVEVFFVLSGFLITSLLLEQWSARGGIDLGAFWLARARRLLPALFAVLLVTSLATVTLYREEAGKLKGPLTAALTYTSNWYLILSEKSYFEMTGRPSALEHLWSLAVEEQFYLIWPLVLALVLSRWGMRRLVVGTLVAALASAMLLALFYPVEGDPSRVYMGTDTRAAGLLVGALLAYGVVPGRLRATGRATVGWIVSGVGLAALAGVLLFMTRVTAYDTWLWRGGFLLLAVVTATLIAAGVHPDARLLSRYVLGNRVMTWIGRRSYGIYLWHWPIFVVTRPRIDLPFDGPLLLALRLALTVGVAELSYRYLEMPVRRGALGRWWRGRRKLAGPAERAGFRMQFAGGALTVLACGAVFVTVFTAAPAPVTAIAQGPSSVRVQGSAPVAEDSPSASSDPSPSASSDPSPSASPDPSPPPSDPSSSASWPALPASLGSVTAIGDSVMLGATGSMQAMLGPAGTIDAAVGRQWVDGIAVASAMRSGGILGNAVVIHLGSNAAVSRSQVDRMMDALAGVEHVVLVTAYVPRPWAAVTNKTLRWAAQEYPQVVIADWRAAALGATPDLLADDGMHVRNGTGARLYARTLRDALVASAGRE